MSDRDPRLIALKRIADELVVMQRGDMSPYIKWDINAAVASLDWAILRMGDTPEMKEGTGNLPEYLKNSFGNRKKVADAMAKLDNEHDWPVAIEPPVKLSRFSLCPASPPISEKKCHNDGYTNCNEPIS